MDTPQAARTEPDITILIPVYKTGALLPRALDNLLAQPHSNIEIVAVNDASPDDAARILADYAARDPRLRIVTHPENRGTLAARLSGITAARGRYIMCLDADDSLEPETFDRLWKVVRKESPDIIDFGARLIAGASRPTTRVVPMGRFHGDAVFEKVFVEHFYSWSLCFKLIRADLCRRAAACVPPEYCIVAEDFYFYSVIAFFARSYRAVPQMYYNYYTGIGVSDNFRMDLPGFRRFLSIFTALSGIRSFLVSQGAFDRYGAAFRVRETEHFDYLFERWECRLKRSLQPEGYRMMCDSYDRETVERQLKRYFSGREQQLEFALSGQSLPEYGTATGGGRVAAPFLICPGGPGLAECWGNWSVLLEELLDRLPELRLRLVPSPDAGWTEKLLLWKLFFKKYGYSRRIRVISRRQALAQAAAGNCLALQLFPATSEEPGPFLKAGVPAAFYSSSDRPVPGALTARPGDRSELLNQVTEVLLNANRYRELAQAAPRAALPPAAPRPSGVPGFRLPATVAAAGLFFVLKKSFQMCIFPESPLWFLAARLKYPFKVIKFRKRARQQCLR